MAQTLIAPDWQQIDTVFLDMDGTLLDLHFDNYFWLEHVLQRYAEKMGISLQDAKDNLQGRYKDVIGTINWYSIDYWTQELNLDIALLKEEIEHLIQVHPYVIAFLDRVRSLGKRIVLVTNAHQKSLDLKMRRTQLGRHLDKTICSHDFGIPKEEQSFWHKLQEVEPFARDRTLFVDDSLSVLRSAATYGISWLVAINLPDSTEGSRDVTDFYAINDFRELIALMPH